MQPLIKINREEILKRYKPVPKDAHKGTQGHALLIGGSYGKMGSVCLSSKAALKTGCGLPNRWMHIVIVQYVAAK